MDQSGALIGPCPSVDAIELYGLLLDFQFSRKFTPSLANLGRHLARPVRQVRWLLLQLEATGWVERKSLSSITQQRLYDGAIQYGFAWKKTKGKCWYCGADLNDIPLDPFQSSVDHQTPQVQGGSDEEDNLVLACRGCNSSKGDRDLKEFRAFYRWRILDSLHKAILCANASSVHWGQAPRPESLTEKSDQARAAICALSEALSTFPILFYGETLTNGHS